MNITSLLANTAKDIKMPSNSYWIDEPTIIGFDLIGDISTSDIDNIGQEGLTYLDDSPCYALINFSETRTLPKNLVNAVLRSNAFINFINHEHIHHFAFVNPSTTARIMIDTIFRDIGVSITTNYEQALDILRTQRDDNA